MLWFLKEKNLSTFEDEKKPWKASEHHSRLRVRFKQPGVRVTHVALPTSPPHPLPPSLPLSPPLCLWGIVLTKPRFDGCWKTLSSQIKLMVELNPGVRQQPTTSPPPPTATGRHRSVEFHLHSHFTLWLIPSKHFFLKGCLWEHEVRALFTLLRSPTCNKGCWFCCSSRGFCSSDTGGSLFLLLRGLWWALTQLVFISARLCFWRHGGSR